MPRLSSTPTLLLAAETSQIVGTLRDTFPARECVSPRGRTGRILTGGTNAYRYHIIAFRPSRRDGDRSTVVPEIAWYTGRLSDTTAVLLVIPGAEVCLADVIRPLCVEPGDSGTEVVPDLIGTLPPDLPIGTVENTEVWACARWLGTRFGPHQVWTMTVPPSIPSDRSERSRYHRVLRGTVSALTGQTC